MINSTALTKTRAMHQTFRTDENGFKTICTPEQDVIIARDYLVLPMKQLSKRLNISDTCLRKRLKQLGLIIPAQIIEKRKKDSLIKPGDIPPNKGIKMSAEVYERCKATMFKKGSLPKNAIGVKDGDVRLRTDKTGRVYKYIRLSLGKWYPLHQHNWEKQKGKIPKGHCLWFLNGDTMDCEVSNLELITRAENMRRNSASLHLTDSFVALSLSRVKGGFGLYDPNLMVLVLKNKPLIELKRQQLKLKRAIYGHKKNNQSSTANEG